MPLPFEFPDDGVLFEQKYGSGGLLNPTGSGGQSPSGVFGGGGLGGMGAGYGRFDPFLAYSPMRRRLQDIPLSERGSSPMFANPGATTMPTTGGSQWGMPGGVGYDPTPTTGPPGYGWGGSYAPAAPAYSDVPPEVFNPSGGNGVTQRGRSGLLSSGSRTILGPTNPGGRSILGPRTGGGLLPQRPPSTPAPPSVSGGAAPSHGNMPPGSFSPGGRPMPRTGNPYIDAWFDYKEGKGNQHTILNLINGIISGALDPYLEGTPFGKTPSAGVMDATRRNATATADALSARASNMGALYGLDPSQRGAANLNSYLNTQGGIAGATNNVLDAHAMAREEWIRSLLGSLSGTAQQAGLNEANNIWAQRMRDAGSPEWYDYLAQIGGQVGGAWLAPGGVWK